MISDQENTKMLDTTNCIGSDVRAMKDALEILGGKWKLPILFALSQGKNRFCEIAHEVTGITDRMLSKELKILESNQLVTRTVFESFPPKVEYSLTEHSTSLHRVMSELSAWGILHRSKILGN
jgi:DNA-binding HxlR family transcriptional regulator